jgi:NAD(P)-dependent dehydrogenase (short-subunit alcohol dehydrogenase family)
MRFTGKVVLVAGGTGGLGRAISLGFLNEGAKVVVTYVVEQEYRDLKATAAASPRLSGRTIDMTDAAAVRAFVGEILNDHGRLDVLVNTIGAYAGGLPLWETDDATFDRMLNLNLRTGFTLARLIAPAMVKLGSGAIVNVAAKAALDHAAGAAAYAASKAAAVALMDSLAADVKGSGVRVNSILPSIIDTAANRKAMPGADFTVWPKAEEIAQVVLFLCSDEAKVVHGAAIPVFGKS